MSDSKLPPDQDDAVRALLADARHTDPTPPEVVARLEDTLASLVAERDEVRAPVVSLASRRRRRGATALLAAAAVVVGGFGISSILQSPGSGDDSSAGSAAESSALDEGSMSAESESIQPKISPESGADIEKDDSSLRSEAAAPLAVGGLSGNSDLRPQVRRLRPQPFTSPYSGSPCLVDSAGRGDVVAITYDGEPGALVYREPVGDSQRVDVFLCGEVDPVRSLRLRAP